MTSVYKERSSPTVVESTCASPRAKWVPGPPKLLLLAIMTMAALHVVLPGVRLLAVPWRLLGLIPLVAGLTLNLLADRAFKAAGTTVKPLLPSTVLIRKGVFRLSRNPMYLGFVLVLAGLWLVLGSITPGLAVGLFAVLIDRYFVRPEEEKLTRSFGPAYTDYCRTVRRWL